MFLRLFLLLLLIPVLDLYLLVKAHQYLSQAWGANEALLFTLAVITLTALVGVRYARYQGSHLLKEARQKMAGGELASRPMLEGLLLLVGAISLIMPGYVTDLFGLILLLPASRSFLAAKIGPWLSRQLESGRIQVFNAGVFSSHGPFQQDSDFTYHSQQWSRPKQHDESVIDVEVLDEKDRHLDAEHRP